MTEITSRIITLIQSIPAGKVSSYRDVARAAGLPNGARQVVRALHSMTHGQNLPWHRVLRADGRIGLLEGYGREDQIILLRSEGVEVSDSGRVDMLKYAVKSFSLTNDY